MRGCPNLYKVPPRKRAKALTHKNREIKGGNNMSDYRFSPCPFCGGQPERVDHGGDPNGRSGRITSFIRCPSCGAQGQKFEISTIYAADNEAVAAWNRRYQP
jgi:Lar family restriction alleviation protein